MKKVILIYLLNTFVLNAQGADQIKKQINEAGLTIDQAKQIANDRGYSRDQIELEAKVQDVGLSNPDRINSFDSNNIDDLDDVYEDVSDINIASVDSLESDVLDYFGYQIFLGDPKAFQASEFGAVDPNYNIGPGDQIILMLWGELQFRQEYTIDREGYVFLPEVGQVFVNGLNLEALEKKIFQILSKVYSTLNPQKGEPTTFMDVSIGDLRPLRIIVLGEVSQPGMYLVSPSASLSSSLYYFNGPTTLGSLRNIELIREGKSVGNIDFYDYLLSGNIPNDIRLQMDDVIFIKPRGKTVTIKGEINRQGIYELNENENLKDLLEIAGKLTASAYTNRTQIERIIPSHKRKEMGMDKMLIDVDLQDILSSNKPVELQDGDIIDIFPINQYYSNYVLINSNSITRPGRYQLSPGMRVLDLISAADGLLNDAYIDRAHIRRIKDDLSIQLITLNLKKVLENDLNQNIELQFMDQLIIYNKNEINNIFTNVTISGPIKNAGQYVFEKDISLGDLIIFSGGFIEGIKKVKISVARLNKNKFSPTIYNFPYKNNFINTNDLIDDDHEINTFYLEPFDIISVYSDPRDNIAETVNISGAIYFPGDYPIISENEKVSDIILRAGGLLPKAYPKASSFSRDDKIIKLSFEEIIKNNKSKDNFNVMPGDIINISTKSNIITIDGEVNQPGLYKYYKGYNINNYINIAGGLTANAEKKEIWVTYADGTSKRNKQFLPSPIIYDSSIITVGSKPETDPIDKTEFAKELASILSDFLQIALTITILSNNLGS